MSSESAKNLALAHTMSQLLLRISRFGCRCSMSDTCPSCLARDFIENNYEDDDLEPILISLSEEGESIW